MAKGGTAQRRAKGAINKKPAVSKEINSTFLDVFYNIICLKQRYNHTSLSSISSGIIFHTSSNTLLPHHVRRLISRRCFAAVSFVGPK